MFFVENRIGNMAYLIVSYGHLTKPPSKLGYEWVIASQF